MMPRMPLPGIKVKSNLNSEPEFSFNASSQMSKTTTSFSAEFKTQPLGSDFLIRV
jgi:hypothetical protein